MYGISNIGIGIGIGNPILDYENIRYWHQLRISYLHSPGPYNSTIKAGINPTYTHHAKKRITVCRYWAIIYF